MKVVYLGNITGIEDRSYKYKEHYSKLMVGKIYEANIKNNRMYKEFYLIKNSWYEKKYFITLEKYRERKINEILT